jgi:hypothetical protein
LALYLVPHVELAVVAALSQVRLAQEAPVVLPDQDGEVRLLAHVLHVVARLRDDDLRGREPQRGVALGLDVDPQVRVYGGRVVVRRNHHQLGAAVARFVHEVDLGDAGVGGVPHPDHDVVGAEPVVGGSLAVVHAPGLDRPHGHVPDPGPGVEYGGTDRVGETDLSGRLRAVAGVGGAVVVDDRLGALVDGGVDQLVRDLVQGLVPGDALPLAAAPRPDPLERMHHPGGGHLQVRVAGALLAAAGISIGYVRPRRLVDGGLLFAPRDPVLDEHIP